MSEKIKRYYIDGDASMKEHELGAYMNVSDHESKKQALIEKLGKFSTKSIGEFKLMKEIISLAKEEL